MSPDRKASAIKIAGFLCAAAALFTGIAILSYLFHWQQDMSLEAGGKAANAAGALGYRTGRFFVGDCFGLGSFAIPIILGALSVRLLWRQKSMPITKICLLALSGAFLGSFLAAYTGQLASLPHAFGGGLGGHCGSLVAAWMIRVFGAFIAALLLLLLTACWLFFGSERFNAWLARLGENWPAKRDKPARITAATAGSHSNQAEGRTEITPPEPTGNDADEGEVEVEVEVEVEIEEEEEEKSGAAEDTLAAPGGMEIITDDTLDNQDRGELSPIDNRMDPPDGLPKYKFPSLDLLETYADKRREPSKEELERNNNRIRAALSSFRIQVKDVVAIVGPTVTLYKVFLAEGVRISEVKRLQEDIAINLKAKGVRIITLDDSVGIEVANDYQSVVPLRSLLNSEDFRSSKAELPIAIGYTITQKVKVFDLADAPHLLVAGATKQGKSVGLNVIVSSLLYIKHPSELKFVFIDPKMVEFSAYSQLLHHYLAVLPDAGSEEEERTGAIAKTPKNAERVLKALCIEMDERYKLMEKAGVNKVTLYNDKYKMHHLRPDEGHHYFPYLVAVVDEYADLTMTTGAGPEAKNCGRSITNAIVRLAQKGRAAGIHVILATQRPSVDVISGLIKSNFPMRIAFRVSARTDSQTILDAPGAEKLIGKGDMLFLSGIDSERIQCGYVSGEEIDAITAFISSQSGFGKSYNTPYYLPSPDEEGDGGSGSIGEMGELDERFQEAAELVVTTQKASTSYLQTRLGMGFAKAARVMGQLETAGIVGPQEGAKQRQVLVPDLASLNSILDAYTTKG